MMIGTNLAPELSVTDEMIDMAENLIFVGNDSISKHQNIFDDMLQTYQEVIRLRKLMQNSVKADLEALQSEYDNNVGKNDTAGELDSLMGEEEQLKQEYFTVQQRQEELSSQGKTFEKQAEQQRKENEQLQEEKDRWDNETTVVMPLKKEKLSLFTLISGIRWDFDGTEDKVEGFITNKSGVKTFKFDKRICSQFSITNSLWDSMSED